jgi:threonine dehydrogenase-like Zn-dependent dehydrogenase
MKNGMLSVVCRQPGELAHEERPLPERKPDEVLIGIRRIGICGTDYHIFEGLHPFLQYPRVMGHEISAEVLEAPKGSAFAEGDPVLVIPYLVCGACVACRRGKTNCCTTLQCLGVHCDGGMTERYALPESKAISIRRLVSHSTKLRWSSFWRLERTPSVAHACGRVTARLLSAQDRLASARPSLLASRART